MISALLIELSFHVQFQYGAARCYYLQLCLSIANEKVKVSYYTVFLHVAESHHNLYVFLSFWFEWCNQTWFWAVWELHTLKQITAKIKYKIKWYVRVIWTCKMCGRFLKNAPQIATKFKHLRFSLSCFSANITIIYTPWDCYTQSHGKY